MKLTTKNLNTTTLWRTHCVVHYFCDRNGHSGVALLCFQTDVVATRGIAPNISQSIFSIDAIVKEMSVKLLTGHLKMETSSVMTLSILNFYSIKILICETFHELRKVIFKSVTSP